MGDCPGLLAASLAPSLPPHRERTLCLFAATCNQSTLYGMTNARPVIVSSGDGGWIHLGPHVARLLAAHGCFVVGFDVKAYLTSFTTSVDDVACRRRALGSENHLRLRQPVLAFEADSHWDLRRRRALGARCVGSDHDNDRLRA